MLRALSRCSWFDFPISSCRDSRHLARIHALLVVSGSSDQQTGHLIAAYARLGDIQAARYLFDRSSRRTIPIWNAIIVAYSRSGSPEQVLDLYRRLVDDRTAAPDSSTFTMALKACAALSDMETGKEIKALALSSGYAKDVFVCSSLLNLYSKCGRMDDAVMVFDAMPKRDIVSWTTMITGFVNSKRPTDAIEVFRRMQLEGLEGDGVAMVGLVQACASMGDLKMGLSIHGYMIRKEIGMDVVIGTGLVDMHAKNGRLNLACRVFKKMPFRNVVSWSALVSGFAQNGLAVEALWLLIEMQDSGLKPDLVALVSALLACSQIGFLKMGKAVHGFILRRFEFDRISGTAAIDMYSKCGRLASARTLFDRIRMRDLISWNAMISSYGVHGLGREALSLFLDMGRNNLIPDHATFSALLSAFSHSGLVQEGWYWFNRMSSEFGIQPNEKHYACVIDLLSRAGHLAEAYTLIMNMVEKPGIAVWVALLSGCRNHGNFILGDRIAEIVFEMNPDDLGIYTLVSNVFAAAKNWDKVVEVRKAMKKMGTRKVPGYSLVEVSGRLHAFLKEDKSHPQYEKIAQMLDKLDFEIRRIGYVPKTHFVLQDLQEDVKESMLCSHSERLAIAFGLLSTSAGSRLLIIKNLRVCGDCHEATKFISKVVNREIVVRDAKRFHHFENGVCSCRDYW